MSTNDGNTKFKINTKSYVPIVTLSTKDNEKIAKLLNEGLKRPVYWNKYKTKIESKHLNNNKLPRFYLDASSQGVRRLFVPAFNNTTIDVSNDQINNNRVLRDSHTKYFLPKVNIIDYNLLIEESFTINQLMIKLKSMMRLERLQQDKEMIIHNRMFVRLLVLHRSLPTSCC